MNPEEILLQLRGTHHSFPVDAVRTIQADPKTYTPLLIDLLSTVCMEYRGFPGFYVPNDAKLAFYLLTEFCVPEAWPVLLEFISLPEEAYDRIIGDDSQDSITKMLSVYLNPETDDLERITTDTSFSFLIRVCALNTLWCWYRDEKVSFHDAEQRTERALRVALDAGDASTIGAFIAFSCPLAVATAEFILEEAIDCDLIDPCFADEEDFEQILDEFNDNPEEKFGSLPVSGVKDTVEELSNLECFNAPPETPPIVFDWCNHDWPDSDSEELEEEYSDESISGPYLSDTESAIEAVESFFNLEHTSRLETPSFFGTIRNSGPRVGRNDPCPCGSGKKYKKCCAKEE
jgi:hypothetical protein